MWTFLLLNCALLLAISCWAESIQPASIPEEHLDDIFHQVNRNLRSILSAAVDQGSAPTSNATYRFYKKRTSPLVHQYAIDAAVFAETASRIAQRYNISKDDADHVLQKRASQRPGFDPNAICQRRITSCNAQSRYRTADGSCNNLLRPADGMAVSRMDRMIPPAYSDGNGGFRRSVTGEELLSPRTQRLILHPDRNIIHRFTTNMIVGFGQFLDHDITSTPENQNLNCCTNRNNRECMAILVPQNDDFYSNFNIGCLDIARSIRACGTGQREQINQNTAFIDSSQIYGSSTAEQRSLRTFVNGMLITDQNSRLLPKDFDAQNCGDPNNGVVCFKAGDSRVNENPGLTAVHTIFMREHNRIVAGLHSINPGWTDEVLFQEAKRIVTAELQQAVYAEFLPVVIGQDNMNFFSINLPQGSTPSTYDSSAIPIIFNSFSTAAFRFGHTLIPNFYNMPGNGGFSLQTAFNNPQVIYDQFANIDRIMLGFTNQPAMHYENYVAEAVTNHLFQPPRQSFGSDLAAFNIQRGRDHGQPTYNAFRVSCGLPRITSFEQLFDVFQDDGSTPNIVQRFRDAYRSVEDIDFWPAGISEIPVNGGIVGPTFACVIGRQFNRLFYGDRFFFTHGNQAGSFTPAQRLNLRQRTLGGIICDNAAPVVQSTQQNVFLLGGTKISCANQVKLNLQNWRV